MTHVGCDSVRDESQCAPVDYIWFVKMSTGSFSLYVSVCDRWPGANRQMCADRYRSVCLCVCFCLSQCKEEKKNKKN